MKLEFFFDSFSKNFKYQISSKSVQWEANCCMRTDGRTDMTKLIVDFRNFANVPKNEHAEIRHLTLCTYLTDNFEWHVPNRY